IPVGLLSDFESGQDFLRDSLNTLARPPILFSLLGGTLGNLDRGEPRFFAGMKQLMRPGDSFLLDIPLAGPAWIARDDPRLDKTQYTESLQRFLARGLAHCEAGPKAESDPRWFDRRIECILGQEAAIAGTKVITVRDRPSGRALLRFN